ncbi:MAG TPA: hypothetical protein VNT54_13090, partial [Solirubrobacteraceae bacterium]|nr:hypothetical protein [Solirubrobacteraceae bacterium]
VRAWFAQSTSRRLAFIADGARYVGSLTPSDVAGDGDPQRPAAEVAQDGPTVASAGSAEKRMCVTSATVSPSAWSILSRATTQS